MTIHTGNCHFKYPAERELRKFLVAKGSLSGIRRGKKMQRREKEREREYAKCVPDPTWSSGATRLGASRTHHAPATVAHALYLSLLLSLLRFCIVTAVTRLACLGRSLRAAKHTHRHGRTRARIQIVAFNLVAKDCFAETRRLATGGLPFARRNLNCARRKSTRKERAKPLDDAKFPHFFFVGRSFLPFSPTRLFSKVSSSK